MEWSRNAYLRLLAVFPALVVKCLQSKVIKQRQSAKRSMSSSSLSIASHIVTSQKIGTSTEVLCKITKRLSLFYNPLLSLQHFNPQSKPLLTTRKPCSFWPLKARINCEEQVLRLDDPVIFWMTWIKRICHMQFTDETSPKTATESVETTRELLNTDKHECGIKSTMSTSVTWNN